MQGTPAHLIQSVLQPQTVLVHFSRLIQTVFRESGGGPYGEDSNRAQWPLFPSTLVILSGALSSQTPDPMAETNGEKYTQVRICRVIKAYSRCGQQETKRHSLQRDRSKKQFVATAMPLIAFATLFNGY
jgi:hypothetical protein